MYFGAWSKLQGCFTITQKTALFNCNLASKNSCRNLKFLCRKLFRVKKLNFSEIPKIQRKIVNYNKKFFNYQFYTEILSWNFGKFKNYGRRFKYRLIFWAKSHWFYWTEVYLYIMNTCLYELWDSFPFFITYWFEHLTEMRIIFKYKYNKCMSSWILGFISIFITYWFVLQMKIYLYGL